LFAAFATHGTIKVLFIWNCKNSVQNKPKKQDTEKKFAGHVFVYEFKDPATTRENNCVVSTQVRVDACATNFPAAHDYWSLNSW
jgi:hypothetical protein